MINTDKEKLANNRIENAKKRIAKALNLLEVSSQEIKWACESMNWNEDVEFQIEEAATKLGFSLATLTNWFDEEENT